MQVIKNTLLVFFFSFSFTVGFAQSSESEASDSIKKIKKTHRYHIKATARLHNKGMFLYGGRLGSDNPAFDVNFTYTRPAWGFTVFKAMDITDHTTPNNFTLATVFKTFKLSNRLSLTPYVGTFLEQCHSLAGHGSDIVALAVTNYKLNSALSIEYTTMFPNLVLEPDLRDWVNRMRILYSHKHWDVIGAFWHNNQLFDNADYTSTALTIGYSHIHISESFNLNFAITELAMLQTSDEEDVPKMYRFFVTASLQFVK